MPTEAVEDLSYIQHAGNDLRCRSMPKKRKQKK